MWRIDGDARAKSEAFGCGMFLVRMRTPRDLSIGFDTPLESLVGDK